MRWMSISIPRPYCAPTLRPVPPCFRQPRLTFTSTARLFAGKRWTVEEEQYALRRSRHGGVSYETIAAELGTRTRDAVQKKMCSFMVATGPRSTRFNKAWTAVEDQTIIDCLAQNNGGRPMAKWHIAKSLGRSESSVARRIEVLRKAGRIEQQAKPVGRPFTPAEDQTLLSLAQDGVSRAEIARTLNRWPASVYSALQRLQTGPLAPRRGRRLRPWSSQEIDALMDQRKSGCSYSEIAQSIGRSRMACEQKYKKQTNMGETRAHLREWTSEEDALLFQWRHGDPRLPYKEIARKMPKPRSPEACMVRWHALRDARGKA